MRLYAIHKGNKWAYKLLEKICQSKFHNQYRICQLPIGRSFVGFLLWSLWFLEFTGFCLYLQTGHDRLLESNNHSFYQLVASFINVANTSFIIGLPVVVNTVNFPSFNLSANNKGGLCVCVVWFEALLNYSLILWIFYATHHNNVVSIRCNKHMCHVKKIFGFFIIYIY